MIHLYLVVEYHESFLSIIDYLINNVFLVLIFPNIAVYGLVIIISNIILIKTILSNELPKLVKRVNIGFYCIIMFLLFLILNVIVTNEIDVYSATAVYTNETLFALIELNMGIFIIWMIGMLISYSINKLVERKQLQPIVLDSVEQPVINNMVNEINNEEKVNNIEIIDDIEIIDEKETSTNSSSLLEEKIIDMSKLDNIEVIDLEIEEEKPKSNELFTLEEYKMLANMLRNQRSL